jgi:hypothetical protein
MLEEWYLQLISQAYPKSLGYMHPKLAASSPDMGA